MPDAYLLIGEITKPQGVRGELKARPITCDPERFYDLDEVYLEENGTYTARGVSVRSVGPDAVFFRMDGVETRDDAEKMRGTLLYIDREHAVELGGNDVYVVKSKAGEILIPALKIVVLEVDINAKRMLLDAQRLREVAVFPDSEEIR